MPLLGTRAATSILGLRTDRYHVEFFGISGGAGGGGGTQTGPGGAGGGTFDGKRAILPGLIFDIVIGGGGTNAGSNAFGSLGTNGSATTGFGLTAAPPSDVLGPTGAYFTSGNGYGPSPSGGGIGYDNRHAGGAGGAADTNVLGPGVSWGESTYGGGGPSGASSKVAGYTGAIAGVDGAGTGAFDGGPALDGAVNRGGGGGGSRSGYFGGSYQSSSNGGSGVFIVRYRGSPRATGGTITEVNGWTYHTFETSGTFTS